MKFSELFRDLLDKDIPDDIAPYFKQQVQGDLEEFTNIKSFINELEEKITKR